MRIIGIALALLIGCGKPTGELDLPKPDPSWPVLMVELDAMDGRALSQAVLDHATLAFYAAEINIQFERDEETIPPFDFDGSFEQRTQLLAEHRTHPDMIHAISVTRRLDTPGRGGEVVASEDGPLDGSGVLVFWDELASLHPACGSPTLPAISAGEARAGTLVHEIGHTLQLGHDTDAGGFVNFYNVMSVPDDCAQAQQRFHGIDNYDATLGATADEAEPRFSTAALQLMDMSNIIGIDTPNLIGNEM